MGDIGDGGSESLLQFATSVQKTVGGGDQDSVGAGQRSITHFESTE